MQALCVAIWFIVGMAFWLAKVPCKRVRCSLLRRFERFKDERKTCSYCFHLPRRFEKNGSRRFFRKIFRSPRRSFTILPFDESSRNRTSDFAISSYTVRRQSQNQVMRPGRCLPQK